MMEADDDYLSVDLSAESREQDSSHNPLLHPNEE
jgi:hypothetical protein